MLPSRPASRRIEHAMIARLAVTALIDEVQLTPKPALVDQRGAGAHDDLDLSRMLASAHALEPTFFMLARAADGSRPSRALRERLARIGRAGERAMLRASGGANTHRGALWVVGLLSAGAAMTRSDAATICAKAAEIARFRDRFAPRTSSNGRRVAARYGVRGARGEACDGFPHVLNIGLPALRKARAQALDDASARLNTLLAIMVSLPDTCLLHRGGQAALDAAQTGARRVLELGGTQSAAGRRALLELDATLLARNASPGGAADLLAATLFIDALTPVAGRERRKEISTWKPSNSNTRVRYG